MSSARRLFRQADQHPGGLDINGRITGAKLVEHHEPLLLVGIPPERITRYINGYVGRNAREISAVGARPPVDIVSGATVTVMVIGDSIMRSAARVARKLEPGSAAGQEPAKPIRSIDAARRRSKTGRPWLPTGRCGDCT
jgi:NosR/NirI family nitrous oxide reductase transcriptional regulator